MAYELIRWWAERLRVHTRVAPYSDGLVDLLQCRQEVGKMSYMAVAVATGVAAVILGLGWMLAGRLMLKRWGIQASPDGVLLGQRLGAVYLGIALMLFLGRSAPPSEFRDAFSWGMVLALGLLAAHGVLCMVRGKVGKAMLVTVVVEVVLAAGFLVVLLGRTA